MTKSGIFLTVIAVILAICYVCFFTDWFQRKTIQIVPTMRPNRGPNPKDPDQEPVFQVSFLLNEKFQLTSVKVVAAADMATNNYPFPLWHLVSDSNSMPVKSINYGYPINGMKPAVPRQRPENLAPDVDYVLLLEAGEIRGKSTFRTVRAAKP